MVSKATELRRRGHMVPGSKMAQVVICGSSPPVALRSPARKPWPAIVGRARKGVPLAQGWSGSLAQQKLFRAGTTHGWPAAVKRGTHSVRARSFARLLRSGHWHSWDLVRGETSASTVILVEASDEEGHGLEEARHLRGRLVESRYESKCSLRAQSESLF